MGSLGCIGSDNDIDLRGDSLMIDNVYIESVVLRKTKPIELKREFYDATMGPFTHFQICTISLTDKDGYTGEAPFMVREGFSHYESSLIPILFDSYGESHEALIKKLYWKMRNFGFRDAAASAISSIDLALHDITAQKNEIPFHRMMGGQKDSCPVYGSGAGVNISGKDLLEEVEYLAEISNGIVKIKVSPFDTEAAYKRLSAVKKHLGDKYELAFDVNQGLSADEAIDFAKKVNDLGITWFEEPVHSADFSAIEKYCLESPISIALGESERTDRSFDFFHKLGVKHFQPQVHKMASVQEWLNIRDLAQEKSCILSSGGIAPLAAQMIATCNFDEAYCELLTPLMGEYHNFMKTPPRLADGKYYIEHSSGLGMNIDWQGINKLDLMGDLKVLDRE